MKNNKIKIISAFSLGGFIGATAGILLAPKKGSETRIAIKNSLSNLKDKALNITEDINTYVEEKLTIIDDEIDKLENSLDFKKAKKQAKKIIKKITKLISYIAKKGSDEFEDLLFELKEKINEINREILYTE